MATEARRCTECGEILYLGLAKEYLLSNNGQYVCSDECRAKLNKRTFHYVSAEGPKLGTINCNLPEQDCPKFEVTYETAEPKVSDISDTLKERGGRYGKFTEQARITQSLKAAMRNSPNWEKLAPDQKEALEMVQHKIARILNGDHEYADSYLDCEGYIRLVRVRLETGESK